MKSLLQFMLDQGLVVKDELCVTDKHKKQNEENKKRIEVKK